ncbi:unknown similar to AMEV001 [Mythimna separata entomopoxvirus 'L']|uniref:Nicotinamide mononucleotide transporter n=1 Tax=Mythimna separata entomopoxvirus 'L' TaxID=1293572 RepID=A0A916KPZ5_9POXV|nr:unknown similar to AMEV001 [Mythimna separata entomopoxvirus 'L']CCU56210.1 unknown similar to AMEV001 [Mythimna separata entomopoxvirus 'L']
MINYDIFKTKNFWIESFIFTISVIGSVMVSLANFNGFWFWVISNILSIIYFISNKQYPLFLQQSAFLITTVLGIYYNWDKL